MAGDEQRNLHSPWTFDITREFTTWVVFIYLHWIVVTHSGQMNGDWHRYDAIIETYQPFINMVKAKNPSPGPGQVRTEAVAYHLAAVVELGKNRPAPQPCERGTAVLVSVTAVTTCESATTQLRRPAYASAMVHCRDRPLLCTRRTSARDTGSRLSMLT